MMRWSPGGDGSSTRSRSENSGMWTPVRAPAQENRETRMRYFITILLILAIAGQAQALIFFPQGEQSSQVRAELGTTYEAKAATGKVKTVHYMYDVEGFGHQRAVRISTRANATSAKATTSESVYRLDTPVSRRTLCFRSEEEALVVTLKGYRGYELTVQEVPDFVYSVGESGSLSGLTAEGPDFRYLDLRAASGGFVRVSVTSEGADADTCATVAVVSAREGCPSIRDASSLRRAGTVYQTMLGFSSFVLDTSDESTYGTEGGAFLAFLLAENDATCRSGSGGRRSAASSAAATNRTKSFSFSVTEAEFQSGVYLEVGLSVIFFCLLCVMALVATCVHSARVDNFKEAVRVLRSLENNSDTGSLYSSSFSSRPASTIVSSVASSPGAAPAAAAAAADDEEGVRREEREFFLQLQSSHDTGVENDVFEVGAKRKEDSSSSSNSRKKTKPKFLSDLPRSGSSSSHDLFYMWVVITLGLFYGVPAFQVVLSHQRELSDSGNQDVCYYNHLCAVPVSSSLRDFNHIFSNVWYVGLGGLFAWLVRYQHLSRLRLLKVIEQDVGPGFSAKVVQLGVPRHYGVFYAIAAAVALQGALSACYHICPTEANFQFDTTFMHVITALCFIKVHQFRHTDADAAGVFLGLGSALCLEAVGIVAGGGIAFWVVALVAYLVLSVLFTAAVVYHPDSDGLADSLSALARSVLALLRLAPRPDNNYHSGRRLALACAVNSLNLCLLVGGAVVRPSVSIYLLAVMVCNLGAYATYYVAMKLSFRERLSRSVVAYFLLGLACWSAAFYFYATVDYSIESSPAESRELNSGCLVLSLFDAHDVWHVLSASGLFCCFMLLLTVDDGVSLVPRNQLRVF